MPLPIATVCEFARLAGNESMAQTFFDIHFQTNMWLDGWVIRVKVHSHMCPLDTFLQYIELDGRWIEWLKEIQ